MVLCHWAHTGLRISSTSVCRGAVLCVEFSSSPPCSFASCKSSTGLEAGRCFVFVDQLGRIASESGEVKLLAALPHRRGA